MPGKRKTNFADLGGWVDDQRAVSEVLSKQEHPLLGVSSYQIKNSGRGKSIVLTDFVTQANGVFNTLTQDIGDCTSFATSYCINVLRAIDSVKRGSKYITDTATEPLYASSRVEIGKGRLGNDDGSMGAWIAEAARVYGSLLRQKYGNHDFTKYSGSKARELGAPGRGIPDELEPESRLHPVNTISLVTSYYDAIDALFNGYPINVCSNFGFTRNVDRNGLCIRDKDGFLAPGGTWAHSMAVLGFDDNPQRPGVLIVNSWGYDKDWIKGPNRKNAPEGSFWVEADVFEKMLAQHDSFSYSNYVGYPPQKLSWRL